MKTIYISLNSIDKVKAFVNEITKFENDFDLVSGRYVIDAKSIMGIFNLANLYHFIFCKCPLYHLFNLSHKRLF